MLESQLNVRDRGFVVVELLGKDGIWRADVDSSTLALKQHNKGKLTASERIKVLLDKNSFEEYQSLVRHRCGNFGMENNRVDGDAVIGGYGKINGRGVFIYAQDFGVFGGTVSESNARKICAIMDMAMNSGLPIIAINDSGGARIQEGVDSLGGYGKIFRRNVEASGFVPQIALVMGPCAGGAVYSPALMDFVFMVANTSHMFLTGPNVIKKVMYEEVSKEDLGGCSVHAGKTGIVSRTFSNDLDLLFYFRYFFSFIPDNNSGFPDDCLREGYCVGGELKQLRYVIPAGSSVPYDVRDVIYYLLDGNDFCEINVDFATNVVVGFGSIGGYRLGIVANQPLKLAGCLDSNASCKAARFIRFCDAFNIPIVSLVDVPGFLPGAQQEHGAIIKHGAKLLYAYTEATVSKITVITRKAYGGAYIVMGSKHLGADVNFAWQSAEIAVMGAEGAVEIIFRNHLSDVDKIDALIRDYKEEFTNPFQAASRGFIDEVIDPADTRYRIFRALEFLSKKKVTVRLKKHGNMPL